MKLAVAVLALTACSRSQADKREQQKKTAASSAATAMVALDAWLSNAAPAHYARRASEATRRKLVKAADDLQQLGSGDTAQHAIAAIRLSSDALARTGDAIDASDRDSVEGNRHALASAAAAIGPSPKPQPAR